MAKYLFLLLLFVLCIAAYGRDWRRGGRKALVWSLVIVSPSLYLSILFLYHPAWPGPGDGLEWLYGGPSDALIRLLTSLGAS